MNMGIPRIWLPLLPDSEVNLAIDDLSEAGGSFAMSKVEIFLLGQQIRINHKVEAYRFRASYANSNLVWIRNSPSSVIAEHLMKLLPAPSYSLSHGGVLDTMGGRQFKPSYFGEELVLDHGVIVRDMVVREQISSIIMTLIGTGIGVMGASIAISEEAWLEKLEREITRHVAPQNVHNVKHIEILIRVAGKKGWPADFHMLEMR